MKKSIVLGLKSYVIVIRWIILIVILLAYLFGFLNVNVGYPLIILFGLSVISNIMLMALKYENLVKLKFDYLIFIIDTALIIYLFFKFDSQTGVIFFPLFFLVVFIAALIKDIKGSIAIAIVLVTFYYIVFKSSEKFSLSIFMIHSVALYTFAIFVGLLIELNKQDQAYINQSKIFSEFIKKISNRRSKTTCMKAAMKFIENIYGKTIRTYYIEDCRGQDTFINSEGIIVKNSLQVGINLKDKKYLYYSNIEFSEFRDIDIFKGIKSLLIVSFETKKLGTRAMISIMSTRYDAFNYEKIGFLTNLIEILKNRITLIELFESSVQKRLEMSSLFEISNVINEPLKWRTFISKILLYSSKLLQTKVIFLYIFNKNNRLERYSLAENDINIDTHANFYPMINQEIIKDLERNKSHVSIARDDKYQEVFLSLFVKNRLIGVIEANISSQYFTNSIETILSFVRMIAVSIENKKLIEENKDKRRSIESIINSLKQPIILVNTKGEITHVNLATKNIFKIDPEKLKYTNLVDFFITDEFKKVLSKNAHEKFTFKLGKKYYYVNVTHILSEENNTIGAILLFTDVTAIKKLDSELILAVAYEIQTPIVSIMSGLDLIQENSIQFSEGEMHKAIDSIKADFEKLTATLDQFLSVGKT